MLETAVVPMAAHTSTEEDWAALEASLNTLSKAVDDGHWNTARDAHLAFHAGLLESLHQPAVQLLLKPMTEVIWLSSEPPTEHEPADWEVETHWTILRALKTRDPEEIEQAVRHHYEVLYVPERYGEYRSRPFRTVFESPQLPHAVAQR
jgi:DNA-binding GntR family transcriptional regulator